MAVRKRGGVWHYDFMIRRVRFREAIPEARTKWQAEQVETQTSARYVHATDEGKRRAVDALASYSSQKVCHKIVTNEERRFG